MAFDVESGEAMDTSGTKNSKPSSATNQHRLVITLAHVLSIFMRCPLPDSRLPPFPIF